MGVTLLDAALHGPNKPLEPRALTLNVYAVQLVRPVTEIGDDAPDAVMQPGVDVTV